MTHIADNQDALLDYLYDEGDPSERLKVARHLQECAECSVAVLEFQNVRGMLRGWTPPASALGFRIVQDGGAAAAERAAPHPASSSWWGSGASRGLLQAAAAVVLFVAGMAVSQLDIEHVNGGVAVRMPSATPAVPARTTSIALPSSDAQPVLTLDDVDRLIAARLASGDPSSVEAERLLQRVRAMIDQSEQRQQRELALRLSQVAGEVDAQHQADLMRIQQSVGQTQDMMEYLVRTSGGTK